MSILFTILVVFVVWSFYVTIGMIVRESLDEHHYQKRAPAIVIVIWPLAVVMIMFMFWIEGCRRIRAKIK